jgi:hypothetical protein
MNMHLFRGGLVSKAHRLFYYSSLGVRIVKKKQRVQSTGMGCVGIDTSGMEARYLDAYSLDEAS